MSAVTVCVIGGDGDELLTATLDSVRSHTPADVPVVVLGSTPAQGDVVLLDSGCVVAAGWLDGLRDAAAADGAVATASALTHQDVKVQAGARFDDEAAVARNRSLRLWPRLPAARRPCVYVRRSALELIGEPEAVGLTRAELSRRCTEVGLLHVLADDVLVLDRRAAPAEPMGAGADTIPTPRAIRAAGRIRRAITGLSAVIDGRILYGPTIGTHVHIVELVAGLARTGKVRLTVIAPDNPSDYAIARLASERGVTLVTYREASNAGGAPADVVHRPFQLSNAGDLTFLRTLGDRLILTQQDLIGYRNPSYFPDPDTWGGYRTLTALALATADRIAFFSSHARADAIDEDLVDPTRAVVVRLGVDHGFAPGEQRPSAPAGVEPLASGAEAILCLGTDFRHKNRVFALRVLEQLKDRHGWNGVLVFAGPTVAHGSSREQEAQWLSVHPRLAEAILDIGAVSEAEKAWLFERSALVLYPSIVEGFGLVPFEAAAHNTPCMWAPVTSLSELLPDDVAGIVPWDEKQSADHALALLRDAEARRRSLDAIRTAAEPLTWDATAAELLELYETAADAPARTGTAFDTLPLGEDAMRLVGPGGELPSDVHRPLLALATHPRIAGPIFSALKVGYNASQRLRRER